MVTIVYDVLVPLFNIKKIVGPDGFDLFSVVTFGTLVSSDDKSFDDFKGKSVSVIDQTVHGKINAKAKKTEYKLDDRKITLDENWSQAMENLWLLGDAALFSVSTIPLIETMKDRYDYFVLRRLLSNSPDSYNDAELITLQKTKTGYTISTNIYQPKANNIVRNVKKLTMNNTGSYDMILFTSFLADYDANKKYFDGILGKN